MNIDQPHRKYRYIEVLNPIDLRRSRRSPWELVNGWLAMANDRDPGSDKALLEGDYLAHLPDGSTFKEVSFKTAHTSVEETLEDWASSVGRRWGKIHEGQFVVNDDVAFLVDTVHFERH